METAREGEALSRRDVLRYGLWGIGACVGAVLGVPVVGYFISPALKEVEAAWVPIASVKDIPKNKPVAVEYVERTKDGWVRVEDRKSAWVVTEDGENFTVFDPRCTHLGCAYNWKEDKQQFLCPCHTATFDIKGNVVSGPPPRPLDRLATKVNGGVLYVGGLIKAGEA
jgi:menaquinol-cytochrome c reductase iron-sulfur subunit